VAAQIAAGSTIRVKDFAGDRDLQLALVTTDVALAMKDAELVICPTPAFAQTDIAALAAPHWQDGQVLFLPPGSFGSIIFARAQHDAGNRAETRFAETGTLPWLVRKHGPHAISITIRARHLPTGVFPSTRAAHALDVLEAAFPGVIRPCGDALSGALMNGGPIIHPPLIIMNAGPLEHFPSWDIHKEGTQPSIRRVTTALDAERIAIREALGYAAPHFPLADHYAAAGPEWMYGRGSHDKLTESGDWREHIKLTSHRYMMEDTRMGLSLLVSLGILAGVRMPMARAFLAIGSAITGQDFMASGRTLDDLGLGGMDAGQLQEFLQNGFP
jgi:opine dehydrogenase